MRRRHHQSTPHSPAAQGFHHRPFVQLASHATRRRAANTPRPPLTEVATVQPEALTDDELFHQEMAGVRALPSEQRGRVLPSPPSPPARPIVDPDADALAELAELIAGGGPFDVADTTEFIEGAVVGLDRRVLRRLRNGEFACQSHLDLHGMTAEQARMAVNQFFTRAHQHGHRCVLIVHGRGLNSKDQVPVLKNRLSTWLARGTWARLVLAFTSARPCDGGVGALYVLLRRQRQAKQPIRVTHGAKW